MKINAYVVVLYQHLSSIVLRSNNRKIRMRLFILYNLQLEIINFL